MRNFLLSVIILLGFLAVPVMAQSNTTATSLQSVQPQDVLAVFPSMSAAANTPALSVLPPATVQLKPSGTNPGILYIYSPKYMSVQAFVTGSPAVCAWHVYGTLKMPLDSAVFPTDYQDLTGALDCTTAAGQLISIFSKPVAQVVISLTTLSGGTTPTVTYRFLGVH